MVTEGNACGAIPWILLGLSMVDTARFQGLHYNHGPTGRAFSSFAAIMCRTVTVVTGTTARVAPTRFDGIPYPWTHWSGHPGRGVPTEIPVGNAVPGVPAAEGGTWMDDK